MVRHGARSGFLEPLGGWETLRAFFIFALLLAILLWSAHAAAFQDMSQLARARVVQRAELEAVRVADAVTSLGRGPAGIDFYRLRQDRPLLERFLAERLAKQPDLRYMDVIDRFGVRLAAAPQEPGAIDPRMLIARVGLLVGGAPQGEVRVGISTEVIDRDIERMSRSLLVKVALFATLGVCLLAVGFIYSLYLIRKNRALDQAKQSAERANYRVNLGSGLAHEIRNPLNSMSINLQMLEEELQGVPALEGGEHVEMLRSIQGEIKRIAKLIDAFLQYARPVAPKFEVKDLNEVLNATARFLQADFRQSGIDLSLDLEPLLPSVELDESQLRQALLNILGNSRQVQPPGGSVRVSTRAGLGGEVLIEVVDTGPGIPSDTVEKIFDPFFSRRAGGTGLGLAIAKQMIENHHGRIEVESVPGRGTTFRIRLPRRHPSRSGGVSAGGGPAR
jgi:signal transduction histidine kinase